MVFQQIRNATIIIKYDGIKILVDPWLVEKGSQRAITSPDKNKNKILNPTAKLPMSVNETVEGIDICIITHLHIDHYDEESFCKLARNIKVYVQNQEDYEIIKKLGYENLEILSETGNIYGNLTIYKTKAMHGETLEKAEGEACGFIIRKEKEPTLYVAGDTVFYDEVKETILKNKPDVIVINACDARLKDTGRLIMNLGDIITTHQTLPSAKLIVSHLDAVNHAYITRKDVKELIKVQELDNVIVPNDGEILTFSKGI